ncbi:MAG: hypothetical protein JNJ83_14990 [Verrucomicrobiaceae bacterium]|nr:hypothetical protein [Verrucomicrobiaceae bacterium]
MSIPLVRNLIIAALTALSLPACNTMKKAVSWVPVPKIPLPSFSSIKRVIPGMDRHDRVDSSDPSIPFSPDAALAPGHTLRIKVYSGSRGANEEFEGLIVINGAGVADFDEYGRAKLGGLSVRDARKAIQTLFSSGGFTSGTLNVHVISIENTKLVFIEGDVVQPRALPWQKRMGVADCVRAAGGRPVKSQARAVYVTQFGQRRFYRSEAVADEEADLEPGDIIFLRPDL